jgi:hypothetical protein
MRLRYWLVSGVVIGVVIAGGFLLWRSYTRFDAEAWRAVGLNVGCNSHRRMRMVGDLVAHHLPPGTRASDVIALLGEPGYKETYPNRTLEKQETYFRENSEHLFGLSRAEYLDKFGDGKLPQEGFLLAWEIGRVGSDCESVNVRFVKGRLIETFR